MNRSDTCCRHLPAMKTRPGSREFYFRCSFCGVSGPPAASADQAKGLWDSIADRCVVVDSSKMARPRPSHARSMVS